MSQMSNKSCGTSMLDEDSSPSGTHPLLRRPPPPSQFRAPIQLPRQRRAAVASILHPASCLAAFHTAPTPTAAFGNTLRACITCVASALSHAINIQMTDKRSPRQPWAMAMLHTAQAAILPRRRVSKTRPHSDNRSSRYVHINPPANSANLLPHKHLCSRKSGPGWWAKVRQSPPCLFPKMPALGGAMVTTGDSSSQPPDTTIQSADIQPSSVNPLFVPPSAASKCPNPTGRPHPPYPAPAHGSWFASSSWLHVVQSVLAKGVETRRIVHIHEQVPFLSKWPYLDTETQLTARRYSGQRVESPVLAKVSVLSPADLSPRLPSSRGYAEPRQRKCVVWHTMDRTP